jgi:hypothetical protein
MFLGIVMPFKDRSQTKRELFNQTCVVLMLYHCITFTNLVPDPLARYKMGYSMVVVTFFNIVVNMSRIAYSSIRDSLKKLRKSLLIRKHRKLTEKLANVMKKVEEEQERLCVEDFTEVEKSRPRQINFAL